MKQATDTSPLAILEREGFLARSRRPCAAASLQRVAENAGITVPANDLETVRRIGARSVKDWGMGVPARWEDLHTPLDATTKVGCMEYAELTKVAALQPIQCGGRLLRGIAFPTSRTTPALIATPDVPGGWGWIAQPGWGGVVPVGETLEDAVHVVWSGLLGVLLEHDPSYLRSRTPSTREPTRTVVEDAAARLARASNAWCGASEVRTHRDTLAQACARFTAMIAPLVPRSGTNAADESPQDEDAAARQLLRAYPARGWDLSALRTALKRRGRHRAAVRRTWASGTPPLLRAFLEECAAKGGDVELGDGGRVGRDHFEALRLGNGDAWWCTGGASSTAHFFDHEEPQLGRGIPLASLLAAWLFYDEAVALGLTEHPSIERRAKALCPVHYSATFPRIVWD